MNTIPYSQWVTLSLPTRIAIAKQFGISKNRSTSVVNNTVVDDGYNIPDVENAISVASLQAFLGTDSTDIITMFGHVVDLMEGRSPEVHVEVPTEGALVEVESNKPITVSITETPKKKGRPAKKSK